MNKIEYKTVKIKKDVIVEKLCDICGATIPDRSTYFMVTTGHHDWGNDSHESIEQFDCCSTDCLNRKFLEYVDTVQDSLNRKRHPTDYFEVDPMFCRIHDYEEIDE